MVLTGGSVGNFTYLTNYNKASAGGAWDYGFDCSACGTGTSPPTFNKLTFEIMGATLSQFVQDSSGNDFSSDIGICNQNGSCTTGPALADFLGGQDPTPVPEPGSLLLVGSGFVTSFMLRRRKKRGLA